jgi:hypothetical protein
MRTNEKIITDGPTGEEFSVAWEYLATMAQAGLSLQSPGVSRALRVIRNELITLAIEARETHAAYAAKCVPWRN